MRHAAEFEKLFKNEVLPLWRKYKKQGKFGSTFPEGLDKVNRVQRLNQCDYDFVIDSNPSSAALCLLGLVIFGASCRRMLIALS
jgi:hypothetical protein